MIRPFQLRDLALVHRLGEHGVVLQAEPALISSPHPLRSALIHMLVGGQYVTYVWRSADDDAAAFVQLQWEEGSSSVSLACLGSRSDGAATDEAPRLDEDVWLAVLDDLVAEIGSYGVHNLIAEVSETGDELPVLRQAGFAVYTRQDIWINDEHQESFDSTVELSKRQEVDDWDVNVLYSSVVPRLIQSVEPSPPLDKGQSWILREDDELAAFVHIRNGPAASWMRLLMHPNAQTEAGEVLKAALQIQRPSDSHPLYCCVRRYQSWLSSALEEAGFVRWGAQAVMVRHIAQRVQQRVPVLKGVLEAPAVRGSSGLVQGMTRSNGDKHA
ncbi:MAG: hypothetical protein R3300_06495 [Candidatus Promineifilaceae bacterium]|nr:hypothetical protein [Candidatus Promineifilaceae bacterium]